MVDSLAFECVQRVANIVSSAFLASMGHRVPTAVAACHIIGTRELRRWISQLGAAHAKPDDAVTPRLDRLDHGERAAFVELALDAYDQSSGDSVTCARVIDRRENVFDNDGDWNPALGMCLRADKHLRMTHVISGCPREIGSGHFIEIDTLLKNREAEIEEIEERLQTVEPVGAPKCLGVAVRQTDAIARRQLDEQLGFQRALEMHMQFGLGQICDEGWDRCG